MELTKPVKGREVNLSFYATFRAISKELNG